jgi:hypothetical protein
MRRGSLAIQVMEAMMSARHEPELIEPDTIEMSYLSGSKSYLSDDGQTVTSIGWSVCPAMGERRLAVRAVGSRSTAERHCRQLMRLLGIKEAD